MYLRILFSGYLSPRLAKGFLTSCPSVVDSYSDVVDGLSFCPCGYKGKEEGDETLLDDEFIREGRLLLAHSGHHLAQVSCRLAGAEEDDVAAQGFHLINI